MRMETMGMKKKERRGSRKRDREGIRRIDRRMEGQEEIASGKREEHPRGAQAPCEDGKAGELLTTPGTPRGPFRERKREGEERTQVEIKRDGMHTVVAIESGRREERLPRGEGVKARARDDRTRDGGREESSPWKSRGENVSPPPPTPSHQ